MPTNTKALQVAEPVSTMAGKNAIINGAMDFWQRGTTAAVATNNYIADRWAMNRGSYNSGSTVSRQLTNDLVNLPNFQYCARVQRDSGNTLTSSLNLWQALENVNTLAFIGKTFTVSFYARAGANYSSTSSLLNCVIYGGTGVDQGLNSMTGITDIANRNGAITTTWQRYSFTGTMASSFAQLALVFSYSPTGTAGANDYFEVTGVQLELGSVATPFSRAGGTIQGELAACQRYYYRQNWQATTSYAIFGTGAGNSTTQVRTDHVFPVPLRTAPSAIEYPTIGTSFTILKYDDTTAGTITATSNDGNISTPNMGRLNWTVNAAVVNVPYYVRGNNNSSVYIGWSAEL